MAKSNAIVITANFLDTDNAKTAHGLIRGTERFNIIGIIDKKYPGKDAMGVLTFENSTMDQLSPESFFVIGKWKIISRRSKRSSSLRMTSGRSS